MTGSSSDLRVSGTSPGSLAQRRSALAVVLAAVLASAALVGGNAAGRPGLAAAVIVLQVLFAAGWLLRFLMPIDAAVLTVASVAVNDVVLLRTRSATAGSVVAVLGLAVVAVLFEQIFRYGRGGRHGVTDAVALTLSVIALDVAVSLLLPLRELPGGRSIVFAGLVCAGAALVVARALPGPDPGRRAAGLVAAMLIGLWCGSRPGGALSAAQGVYLGLAIGAGAVLIDRLLQRIPAPVGRDMQHAYYAVVAGLLPLFLAAPIAYLIGRAVTSGR